MKWSAARAGLIAGNTFREAIRMKLFLLMLILATAAFASSFLFKEFNFGSSELKFIADFGFGGMTLFGPILAIIVSAQLFIGEIEHRTALTILAKPLYRSEYVIGKFVGSWLITMCFIALLSICLIIALWIRESSIIQADSEAFTTGRIINWIQVCAFALVQVLKLSMLCSLVALFSSYATSTIFAMSMGFLVWIAAQLQYIASDAWSAGSNWLYTVLFAFASLVLPNFHLFEIGDYLALGETIKLVAYLKLALYAIVYTAFYLSLAVVAFNRREF